MFGRRLCLLPGRVNGKKSKVQRSKVQRSMSGAIIAQDQTLDSEPWTLDFGLWTLDFVILDFYFHPSVLRRLAEILLLNGFNLCHAFAMTILG